jgi:beta-N-acetylhexosaminidase
MSDPVLKTMPTAEQVGQLFFIGIPGPELDAPTKELLDEVRPGGVCFFARNIRTPSQTRELIDSIREYLKYEPLLSLDQEGGTVDRLRRIMTPMPSASKMRTPDDAAELGAIVAVTLRLLGFNMDFAPVVDVVDQARADFSRGLASRTFGNSKGEVVDLAGEFLRSLQAGGITGCLKHFPGLGAATVDSHEDLPQVTIAEAEFRQTDLFPYRTLIKNGQIRAIMVAHASFQNLALQEVSQNGKLLPSSLSYNFVTTLLRGELAFDGLVITDDLEMGAIVKNFGIGDACKMALKAGVDMLAVCADPAAISDGFKAILDAATEGEVESELIGLSLERLALVKRHLFPPMPFDAGQIDILSERTAELSTRLGF